MARWVADRPALNDALAALRASSRLALDTEFERIRTYWPKLALVQAMLADDAVLIDPLAFDVLHDLGDAISQPGQTWLMHSPSEDLVALAPLLPRPPEALFDTQLAAALGRARHRARVSEAGRARARCRIGEDRDALGLDAASTQ
ncbi:MAG: hypothetical protein IPO95_00035 [Rhodanobacteraceae bacterium]|nr:hypothetical protein [Rhodanobacteraceae bacterium]